MPKVVSNVSSLINFIWTKKNEKLKFHLCFIFVTLYSVVSLSQANTFGLKNPLDKREKKCGECVSVLQNMPNDVRYGFQFDDNDIYFVMTDIRWFDQIFKKKYDGVAIDIIFKEQFICGEKNKFIYNTINSGILMAPAYLKEMKSKAIISKNGEISVKIGTLDEKYLEKDFELNLLILKNKYVCYHKWYINITTTRWKLLEMGLYLDTLSSEKIISSTQGIGAGKYRLFSKRLKFIIPFEKNKSEYSPEDIKPIYDSLNLTDYNIKKITIRAYSSVEGSTERNILLQNNRAQSIVKALQTYQNKSIKTEISVSENWVEFLNDISTTRYKHLATLSKEEVKKRLEEKLLLQELEFILKNHRKVPTC
ncbi:MAG: hypothetical protein IIA88_07525 [Bacteroidetes bacterium]|nr:hypothetical protein [Bacteroidota bacterium]